MDHKSTSHKDAIVFEFRYNQIPNSILICLLNILEYAEDTSKYISKYAKKICIHYCLHRAVCARVWARAMLGQARYAPARAMLPRSN